jgi:hypothetical protein
VAVQATADSIRGPAHPIIGDSRHEGARVAKSPMLQTLIQQRVYQVVGGDKTPSRKTPRIKYKPLHVGFTIAPILAGLDKFFDVLVNWDAYVAPIANRVLAGHGRASMQVVGVSGCRRHPNGPSIKVFLIGRVGLAAWGHREPVADSPSNPLPHYDVALPDFGFLLGAPALARPRPRLAR